jgi:hypothetical protein
LELLLALVIVLVVGVIVSVPLRRRAGRAGIDPIEAELAELEARKRARYREIRDAESDLASGKLSEEDHRRIDAELRREAIEILKREDRLRGSRRPDPGADLD